MFGFIILLFIALIILIILNNTKMPVQNTHYQPSLSDDTDEPLCDNTHFGCCPNSTSAKTNLFGTNC